MKFQEGYIIEILKDSFIARLNDGEEKGQAEFPFDIIKDKNFIKIGAVFHLTGKKIIKFREDKWTKEELINAKQKMKLISKKLEW